MTTAAHSHAVAVVEAIRALDLNQLSTWGATAAGVLIGGGRLLAAGNGGSAAQAQHLTAELVGRFRVDREPLSAIALHAETSSLTAVANDFGYDEAFARQVWAHGREGDILVLLSTSGRSPSVVKAAEAGRRHGLRVWSLTGAAPNPLASASAEAVVVPSEDAAAIQDAHQVAVHILAMAIEDAVVDARRAVAS